MARGARRKADPDRPVAVWSEPEMLDGRRADALVVILRSSGCRWSKRSGCLMCGYNEESLDAVGPDDLVRQFQAAMERYGGQEYVKIYTSGSFLDPGEIPPDARDRILAAAGERARRVLVESRPEYMSRRTLETALENVDTLEVAVGLETASDDVRERCVNKGFSLADFERAAGLACDMGVRIRTYLLLKPPYLSEGQAISDVLGSISAIGGLSQTISVNPVNVQRRTPVERLWRGKLYRPPWLWSLVRVLAQGKDLTDARLMSSPSGGGSPRGAHNCGECDTGVLGAVAGFSLEQDPGIFRGLACSCRERWLDYLDMEGLAASTGDLEALALPR